MSAPNMTCDLPMGHWDGVSFAVGGVFGAFFGALLISIVWGTIVVAPLASERCALELALATTPQDSVAVIMERGVVACRP